MEVMCQIEIAYQLKYITIDEMQSFEQKINDIAKMLMGFRRNLEEKL